MLSLSFLDVYAYTVLRPCYIYWLVLEICGIFKFDRIVKVIEVQLKISEKCRNNYIMKTLPDP